MKEKRSSFSGRIGFILTAVGSAVGLGNIWRFPYLAAKYGGGIFLLVYVILALSLGFALMVAEIAIGRKTGLSPIGAFSSLDKRFSFVGALASAVPFIILPYYSVIGGWVIKYAFGFISGQNAEMANISYFASYISNSTEPFLWFFVFLGISTLVVLIGVNGGVERVSKLMMPALAFLVLFIALYAIFALEGAKDGLLYYIKPDLSKFSLMTVVAALGQLFYSMSIAMGVMITFGSYMKKDISIQKSVRQIEFFDTGVAFLSGLMIIPAVFAYGGEKALNESGQGLMFVTLPRIFSSMSGGGAIGAIFFIMVFFAALTSSVALMETVVSVLIDNFKISRRSSCAIVLAVCLLFGSLSVFGYSIWADFVILGMNILDFFDFIGNSILMPSVAFLTCIFVGYVIKPKSVCDELEISDPFPHKKRFSFIIRYIAPVCIVAILVSSILSAAKIITV